MGRWKLVGLVMVAILVSAGCTGNRELQVVQQSTMYSSMDSTALVYSDTGAAALLQDHPLRWIGFALHPIGVAVDYAFNRPFYNLASTWPGLFGFTSEDAMVHAQRTGVMR
ncbi:MAG: hypothetical protein FJ246_09080 [Nitrospira sp.]|nr:hypothetical protein [Nitrospira sp.]